MYMNNLIEDHDTVASTRVQEVRAHCTLIRLHCKNPWNQTYQAAPRVNNSPPPPTRYPTFLQKSSAFFKHLILVCSSLFYHLRKTLQSTTQRSSLTMNSPTSSSMDSRYTPSSSSIQTVTNDEQWHTVLVDTVEAIKEGHQTWPLKIQVCKDDYGQYKGENINQYHIGAISVKLSSTYDELKERINADVPEQVKRRESGLNYKVVIEKLTMTWIFHTEMMGRRERHTEMNEGNCERLLRLMVARGCIDVLRAYYVYSWTWICGGGYPTMNSCGWKFEELLGGNGVHGSASEVSKIKTP